MTTTDFDWFAAQRVIQALFDNRIKNEQEITAWLLTTLKVNSLFLINAGRSMAYLLGQKEAMRLFETIVAEYLRGILKLVMQLGGMFFIRIKLIVLKELFIIEESKEDTNGQA